MSVMPALARVLERRARRAWARAGSQGDRAFLVVASTYWDSPPISQHDVARTFSELGPTLYVNPTWTGNKVRWPVSFATDGPTVVNGPAIPRGVRFAPVSHANLLLGIATWRALIEAAPRGRRLLTWVTDWRLVPTMNRERFRPSFVFHNVDIIGDGREESAMGRLATLCASASPLGAEIMRRVNSHTLAIGHGVTRAISAQAAQVAHRRAANPGPHGRVGFVGYWDYRVDEPLVRRMLEAHPQLELEATCPPGGASRLERDFPRRFLPVGLSTWSDTLERATRWDASIVPYDVNSTFGRGQLHHSCPYKVFPLIAANVPVVSVEVPSLHGLSPLMHVAADATSFVELVGQALGGELRCDGANAARFREERAWNRILTRVIDTYDELQR